MSLYGSVVLLGMMQVIHRLLCDLGRTTEVAWTIERNQRHAGLSVPGTFSLSWESLKTEV